MHAIRDELRGEIAGLRTEMGELRRDLEARIVRLEERVSGINRLLWGVLVVVVLNLLKGWLIP